MTTIPINRTSASIYRFNAAEATRRRPKKEYIFSSCSPESIAMLVGGGGLGKSYLALQLMVTLALADNSKLAAWALAFNVKKPRSSAFISLEDPADELHFRLQAIAKHLQLDDAECDTIGSMCSFPTLVGSDFNIADPSWRDDVVSALKAAHPDGLDLLVIDTLSAAHRANETDNTAMGEVMSSIGMIGAALGCAVLIIHHVAKDTLKAGTTNTASAARGASATTNRVRYQASVSATDNADILSFEVSKVNGGIKPKPQLWRLVDGAGDRINLVPQASTLNRKDWKAMETLLANELKAGKAVNVKIDVGYPSGNTLRPNEFKVTAIIDGKPREWEFDQ